ncbi:MAG: hypothetical protein ABR543_19080 [Gemmatimonadaceae bacterium]
MRIVRAIGAAMIMAGCASGGGSIFPEAGEPNAAIANAQRLIAEAQQAGADSLAREALATAQQNVAAAQTELRNNNNDRAALKAREAAADATFAREQARRVLADREQARARGALDALPPNGGAR